MLLLMERHALAEEAQLVAGKEAPQSSDELAAKDTATLCANRSQGLSRALLMEYRAAMLEKKLSASTVNVRLSAVRKLIGEAQRNGIIDAEEAAPSPQSPTSLRREPGWGTG